VSLFAGAKSRRFAPAKRDIGCGWADRVSRPSPGGLICTAREALAFADATLPRRFTLGNAPQDAALRKTRRQVAGPRLDLNSRPTKPANSNVNAAEPAGRDEYPEEREIADSNRPLARHRRRSELNASQSDRPHAPPTKGIAAQLIAKIRR